MSLGIPLTKSIAPGSWKRHKSWLFQYLLVMVFFPKDAATKTKRNGVFTPANCVFWRSNDVFPRPWMWSETPNIAIWFNYEVFSLKMPPAIVFAVRRSPGMHCQYRGRFQPHVSSHSFDKTSEVFQFHSDPSYHYIQGTSRSELDGTRVTSYSDYTGSNITIPAIPAIVTPAIVTI